MLKIRKLLILCGIVFYTEGYIFRQKRKKNEENNENHVICVISLQFLFRLGTRVCPEPPTKAHLTRCDMYFKCSVMKSDNIVWLAENCPNGLVYDSNYGNCVVPGECK